MRNGFLFNPHRLSPSIFCILFSIFYLGSSFALGCSLDAFVPSEFTDRCFKMADQVKDISLARKLALPDAGQRTNRFLRSWVAFYLDHGKIPPPLYNHLSFEWASSTYKLGARIARFQKEDFNGDLADQINIPLELLAQPQVMLNVRNFLASWSLELVRPYGNDIDSNYSWIQRSGIGPMETLKTFFLKYRNEILRVSQFQDGFSKDLDVFLGIGSASNSQNLIESMQLKIKSEFEHWKEVIIW